jgi:hypothetical protein
MESCEDSSLSKNRGRKRERDLKYKNHLKKMEKYTQNWFYSPIYYVDEYYVGRGRWVENPKPYYKRIYRGKRSRYYKKQSNKKIRKYRNEIHKGSSYKKVYDFWWNLW